MSQSIGGQEVLNAEDISGAIVRTKCPQHLITHEMVQKVAVRQNLGAGDIIRIQCFEDSSRARFLAETEYRVVSRKEEMRTTEKPDMSIHQAVVTEFEVVQWQPWRLALSADEKGALTKKYDQKRSGFDIFRDDEKVAFVEGKAMADAILEGKILVPAKGERAA